MEIFIEKINDYKDKQDMIKELSAKRQSQFYKFRQEKDRLACLSAGMMIKKHISNEEVLTNKFKKPYIKNAPFFNISHSKDYVILVKHTDEIGCDIQYHFNKDLERIAKRVFHPKEFEYLKSKNFDRYIFYKFWALKESYMKMLGKGFFMNSKSFCLDISDIQNIRLTETSEIKNCSFIVDESINNYTIAVCLKSKTIGIYMI